MEGLIEKEFVPYELALKLKELGFNKECFGFYETLKKVGDGYCLNNYAMWGGISQNISESDIYHLYITANELYGYYDNILRAPTWQQAFKFIQSKVDLYQAGFELSLTSKEWLLTDNIHYWTNEKALKKLIELVTPKTNTNGSI